MLPAARRSTASRSLTRGAGDRRVMLHAARRHAAHHGGGFLGFGPWLAQRHVFTSAMSGAIVPFSVAAAKDGRPEASRRIPPTLDFFAGALAAQWLCQRGAGCRCPSAPALSLCVEMTVLASIAALPASIPDMAVVVAIAFVAAMQNSSFERVGEWSYASVVTTGNARSAAEAFYAGVFPRRDPAARRKAKVFGTVCAGFAAGALLGAVLTTRFGTPAILAPVALQALVLLLLLWSALAPPAATVSSLDGKKGNQA